MATETRWMNAVVRFSKLLEPALSDDADDAKVALRAARILENGNLPDIDVVVTDIVMPKIDGLMLADMIKPQRPDLRILYTTGYADIEAMRSGTRLSDVIWKPYRSSELVATVKRALDTAAPSAA